MHTTTLRIETASRFATDLTSELRTFCAGRPDGLANVFVPHATAGIALIETGSGTEPDLIDAIERLLPTDDIYRHRHGSFGHGRDHVLPAFVSPSVTIPVVSGEPLLGIWQSVVLIDSNGDNPVRTVHLSLLEG